MRRSDGAIPDGARISTVTVRVPFFDTDAMGIVQHHTRVNDHDTVVADDHRDVRYAESNRRVNFVSDTDDLLLKLFRLLSQLSGRRVLLCDQRTGRKTHDRRYARQNLKRSQ